MNGSKIIQPLGIIDVFLSEIGEYQEKGYNYIIDQIRNKVNKSDASTSNKVDTSTDPVDEQMGGADTTEDDELKQVEIEAPEDDEPMKLNVPDEEEDEADDDEENDDEENHSFLMKNAISHRNFDEILSGFREHVQKCLNSLKIPEILQNFDEKSVKFPKLVKNSAIEKFNISILS